MYSIVLMSAMLGAGETPAQCPPGMICRPATQADYQSGLYSQLHAADYQPTFRASDFAVPVPAAPSGCCASKAALAAPQSVTYYYYTQPPMMVTYSPPQPFTPPAPPPSPTPTFVPSSMPPASYQPQYQFMPRVQESQDWIDARPMPQYVPIQQTVQVPITASYGPPIGWQWSASQGWYMDTPVTTYYSAPRAAGVTVQGPGGRYVQVSAGRN